MGLAKELYTMKHSVTVGRSPVSRVLVLESDIIQFSYTARGQLLKLQGLAFSLPVADVLKDDLGGRLGGILSADALDKIVIGI